MYGIDDEYLGNAAGLADALAPPPPKKSAVIQQALRGQKPAPPPTQTASTSLTQNVQPQDYRSEQVQRAYRDIDSAQAEIDKYTGPQDYTAMQEYAKQRGAEGSNYLIAALMAKEAGDEHAPQSAMLLKQAMEMRSPLKTATGIIDESGRHIEDPQAKAEQRIKLAQQRLTRAEAAVAAAATAQERKDAQDAALEARKEMFRLTQSLQKSIADQGSADRRYGYDLAHEDRVAAREAAAAKPPESIQKLVTENAQSSAAVQGGLAAVKSQPGAFGMVAGAANLLPGAVGTLAQTGRDRALTKEQIAARAMVFNNVSKIINERAGAAQSVQELQRLRGFLPSDTDGAREVEAKLEGFAQYLKEQETAIRGSNMRAPAAAPGAAPRPPVQQRAQSYMGG